MLGNNSDIVYLTRMMDEQAELLHNTRSLVINSSILHLRKDNDELKQSVRIAENEMKIIMLTDQVIILCSILFVMSQKLPFLKKNTVGCYFARLGGAVFSQ